METPDTLAGLLRRIANSIQELQDYAEASGFDSIGDLLDAILVKPTEQPSQVGWPPTFEAELIRHSTTPQGQPVLAFNLKNIDRDLTSFEVRNADFGTADLVSLELGEKLEDLSWFSGANQETGRLGAFQSSIREYDDNPSEYETITLAYITLSEDSYIEFPVVGVSGNYDRGDGRGERHFTYHLPEGAIYTPED